jgi:hypothetical protein
MKKYVVSLIFLSLIFGGGLISLGSNGPLLLKGVLKQDFSLNIIKERTLFDETEVTFYENFPFRSELMRFATQFDKLKGIRNEFTLVDSNAINVAQAATKESDDSPVEKRETNIQNSGEPHLEETDSFFEDNTYGTILIYNNDTALELNIKNELALSHYASSLSKFAKQVDANVKVYSLLVPTQIEFVDNDQIKEMSYSQIEGIQRVNQELKEVTPVNTYDLLKAHATEYLYFRTDHHWTQLGAYYGYLAFAETLGLDPVALDDMQHFTIDDYVGSLYRMTQNELLKNKPDSIEVYEPKTASKLYYGVDAIGSPLSVIDIGYAQEDNKYAVFLNGDAASLHIVSDTSSDESIVIVKDSYANAFIPFLTPHFKDIYIIDPRIWEGNLNQLIRDKQIDHVLFLNYALINRYDSYSSVLEAIMSPDEAVLP